MRYLFIHLPLLSTCPYHIRPFNLSFNSKGASFNRPYIVDRLTLSSAFIFSIQHNIGCSLHKRCCTSFCKGHRSLAWNKVPLTKLLYNFPCLAKEIDGCKKRKYAGLVHAIVASSQPSPGHFVTKIPKPIHYIKLSALQNYLWSTGLQRLMHLLHLLLGSAFNLPLKPLHFFYYISTSKIDIHHRRLNYYQPLYDTH